MPLSWHTVCHELCRDFISASDLYCEEFSWNDDDDDIAGES